MRTYFETYLIDAINNQIEDFDGDLEHYGEVFGMADVQLDDLAFDNKLDYNNIGYWVVIINQDGQVALYRYRTYSQAEQSLVTLKSGYALWCAGQQRELEKGSNAN